MKAAAYASAGAFVLALFPLAWLGASAVHRESQYWPNSHHQSMPWSSAVRWVLATYVLGAVAGLFFGSCLAAYRRRYRGRPFRPINSAFWPSFSLICFLSFWVLPKFI